MSEWFHAEGNRQQGPLPAEQLVELFRNNQISLDTLVSVSYTHLTLPTKA